MLLNNINQSLCAINVVQNLISVRNVPVPSIYTRIFMHWESQMTFIFLHDLDLLSTWNIFQMIMHVWNPIIESNIIKVGQVVPEICHVLFSMSDGDRLGFWAVHVSKKWNPRCWYNSYPKKVKSITISIWASDSYGTVKSIHGGLHCYVSWLVECVANYLLLQHTPVTLSAQVSWWHVVVKINH